MGPKKLADIRDILGKPVPLIPCDIHGDDHPIGLCPLKPCKKHSEIHANCMCPDRDPVGCAREMLELVLEKEDADIFFEKPRPDFDGLTPQQVIDSGLAVLVRDLVWDMITGAPF